MATYDRWTYYTYGGLAPGDHITYLRYRPGVAELFSTRPQEWVPTSWEPISRYIENGEISLNETTQDAIESALGVTLPD